MAYGPVVHAVNRGPADVKIHVQRGRRTAGSEHREHRRVAAPGAHRVCRLDGDIRDGDIGPNGVGGNLRQSAIADDDG